jgi:hypothetical protein
MDILIWPIRSQILELLRLVRRTVFRNPELATKNFWYRSMSSSGSGRFTAMPVPEPNVFKYGVLDPGEGQRLYRFEFYEGYIVNAWTRPLKASRYLHLPAGSSWVRPEK